MLLSHDPDMINNLKIILKLYLNINDINCLLNSQGLVKYKYKSCNFTIYMIILYLYTVKPG